jgi:hypothetical protein
MKSIASFMVRGVMIAALLALGSAAAHAQVWPTANPYSCDWTLGSTSGKAFVTFQYTGFSQGALSNGGNLRTVYPTGATVNKPFTLAWDWSSWSDYRFDFTQTQDGITCTLITANAGKDVTFYPCSNGAWQHCTQ